MTAAVRADRSHLAERLVLAGVTAIAALISYTHLRSVWLHTGAPWDRLGPLLPDGLFASAWLQMRRRRHQAESVGWLAWLALGVALLATLGGNIAAAVIAGHRDLLSLVVAGLPAAVFALAWELTTGHARQVSATPTPATSDTPGEDLADETPGGADLQVEGPGEDLADAHSHLQSIEEKVAHLVHAKGYGRPRIAKELDVKDHIARDLLATHRDGCQACQEAAG